MPIQDKKIDFCDISVNPNLLNISRIAKTANLSQPYTIQLIKGQRNNKKAKWLVRCAIVSLYNNIITFRKEKNL